MAPSSTLLEQYAPLTAVQGCPSIVAHQSVDVFALWQAWEAECGAVCDVPYWSIVWPAAQVLSQFMSENPSLAYGKGVLDCGCGGGVSAITAAVCGARRVIGCDVDGVAGVVGQCNAAANDVGVKFVCQDVIECCDPQEFDLILVADLFYQKEFSACLLAALQKAHMQGCEVIIADSGRPFLPKETLNEIHSQTVTTLFDVEGCISRVVKLYKFSR